MPVFLSNWRTWVLLTLLLGPILAYIILGALWLAEHRGPLGFRGELLMYASLAWIAAGVAFSVLANRWTRHRRPLLPPLNWDAPATFNAQDRAAWEIVQREADQAESLTLDQLMEDDLYVETGRRLAHELSRLYHPESDQPLEGLPVVEILTALQLAAEDLAGMLRAVPGGDLITPGHWRKALQAANYFSRANELYTYVLPLLYPVAGVGRLLTQKLVVERSWRDMQQNIVRWFFRAYVNRLGLHLVELCSGRLVLGARAYRRLSRPVDVEAPTPSSHDTGPLVFAVAGAEGSGKSTLIANLTHAREHLATLYPNFHPTPEVVHLLRNALMIEVPGYPKVLAPRQQRRLRQYAEDVVRADFLLLTIDGRSEDLSADRAFLEALVEALSRFPRREAPPIVVILTHAAEAAAIGGSDVPLTKRIEAIRAAIPAPVVEVGAVDLRPDQPGQLGDWLLPAIVRKIPRAERVALLRQLDELGGRSKARRLLSQLGQQGRHFLGRLWSRAPEPEAGPRP